MIKTVELFAGVGGFRLGLQRSSDKYHTVYANQWEPGKKVQHAYNCYVKNFGESVFHVNEDIAKIKNDIPKHDLLTGGFPCQDYSVARTSAKGIEGKKGVLWWEINDIINRTNPRYILLENVDRLIKSPANQRGRDFAIILKCLDDLGYNVEWRVINAAEYGHAQKRRRTFIFASKYSEHISSLYCRQNKADVVFKTGFFASAFPVIPADSINGLDFEVPLSSDLLEISKNFMYNFENAGFLSKGNFISKQVSPYYTGISKTLEDILEAGPIDESYYINGNLEKWEYLKGAKKEIRYKPNGEQYNYTEGAIPYPDNLNTPSRTMLTSEASLNRSSHIIKEKISGRMRVLTQIECERLNEFPDNWTKTGMPEKFRYFVMGNALVVGLIERMGRTLIKMLEGQ